MQQFFHLHWLIAGFTHHYISSSQIFTLPPILCTNTLQPERSSLLGITAKVADFGLAAFISPTDTHVSNYKGGTPIYVAPEVVAHARLSKASDIFALGVIMW